MNKLKKYAGLLNDEAPKDHFLAYITPNERDMLVKSGGSGHITKSGIPSFEESWDMSVDYSSGGSDNNNQSDNNNDNFVDIDQHNIPTTDTSLNIDADRTDTETVYDTSLNIDADQDMSWQDKKMIDETNRARRETNPAEFDRRHKDNPETIKRTKEIQAFENKYKKANMFEHYFYDKFPNNPKNELAYLNSLKASGAYIPPELQSILNAANKQGKDYKVKFTADQFNMVKGLRPTDGLSFSQYMLVGDPDRGVRPNPGLHMGGNVGNFYSQNEPSWWNESKHGTWKTHKEDTIRNMGLSTGQQDDENRWSRVADSYIVGGTTPQESMVNKYFANLNNTNLGINQNYLNTYNTAKTNIANTLNMTQNTSQYGYNNILNDTYARSMTSANPFFEELTSEGLI